MVAYAWNLGSGDVQTDRHPGLTGQAAILPCSSSTHSKGPLYNRPILSTARGFTETDTWLAQEKGSWDGRTQRVTQTNEALPNWFLPGESLCFSHGSRTTLTGWMHRLYLIPREKCQILIGHNFQEENMFDFVWTQTLLIWDSLPLFCCSNPSGIVLWDSLRQNERTHREEMFHFVELLSLDVKAVA